MNTKVKNTVIAAIVAVLASSVTALGNSVSMASIDEGASSAIKGMQQKAFLVSATPTSIKAYEVVRDAASQAKKRQLRSQLEALGIKVD